jgi:calcium-dependent protein kinase
LPYTISNLNKRLCEGGELFDRIIEKGHFTEKEARDIFTQLMQALHYCHQNKICHRDLKPENFLLVSKDPKENQIKIIDFGLSTYIGAAPEKPGKISMTTKAGTVRASKLYYKDEYNLILHLFSL